MGYELSKLHATADAGKITEVFTAYLSKASRSTMKKYWISFYLLAGLVQLAVWKDKLISEMGVFPLMAVAIGYLAVLGIFGFLAARGAEAIRNMDALKQKRIAQSLELATTARDEKNRPK